MFNIPHEPPHHFIIPTYSHHKLFMIEHQESIYTILTNLGVFVICMVDMLQYDKILDFLVRKKQYLTSTPP